MESEQIMADIEALGRRGERRRSESRSEGEGGEEEAVPTEDAREEGGGESEGRRESLGEDAMVTGDRDALEAARVGDGKSKNTSVINEDVYIQHPSQSLLSLFPILIQAMLLCF